jgi:hypothetical protein
MISYRMIADMGCGGTLERLPDSRVPAPPLARPAGFKKR